MKNLVEHTPALGDTGIGATVLAEGLEEHLHIVGLDVSELAHPEIVLQNAQGVTVVLLGGCGDVVLMVFKPDVCPVAEGVATGGIDSCGTIIQKLLQLFSGFLLGFPVDGFVVGFAVGLRLTYIFDLCWDTLSTVDERKAFGSKAKIINKIVSRCYGRTVNQIIDSEQKEYILVFEIPSNKRNEKMILKYIETNYFDQILYKKTVEEETINLKYVKKNNKAKILKLLKIVIIAIIPYLLITSSMKFDKYVFKNYNTYNFDGINYVHLTNDEEVAYLLENNIIDKNDYKHEYVEMFDRDFYNYTYIRADKLEYAVVRKHFILNILVPVTILVSVASVVVAALKVIEELLYINKNYKRTSKGTELLNKAYALKNYLKDYSLIKEKNAKELALWENYLIYAVALDVNTKIEDEIIEKYVNI